MKYMAEVKLGTELIETEGFDNMKDLREWARDHIEEVQGTLEMNGLQENDVYVVYYKKAGLIL